MIKIKERTYAKRFVSFFTGVVIGWFFYLFIFATIVGGEEIPEKYVMLSVLLSLITMIFYMIISEHNYIKRLDLATESLCSNISVFKKRESKLLSKAEQIISTFLNHESDIHKSVAASKGYNESNLLSQSGALTLSDLKITLEKYPNLKADQHIFKILEQLEESQNMILNSKLLYNEYVSYYNAAIVSFPASMFSGAWNLVPRDFYADNDVDDI